MIFGKMFNSSCPHSLTSSYELLPPYATFTHRRRVSPSFESSPTDQVWTRMSHGAASLEGGLATIRQQI